MAIKITPQEYEKKFGVPMFQNIQSEVSRPSLVSRILQPAKDALGSLATLYGGSQQGIADKLKQDVQAGAQDISQGNVVKGVVKSGARTAGDVAGAIYAPVGAVLEATGVNKVFEQIQTNLQQGKGLVGMGIDKLTDIPAVQDFVMKHPNAEEDFGRAMNIILGSLDKGKIEPSTVFERTKAQLTPAESTKPTPPISPTPTTTPAIPKENVIDKTIKNVIDRISSPNVSDATRVSLNPVEALKGTGQDMRVTVGGKSKLVSELTPDEINKLKVSTTKDINNFTTEAEKYKNTRNPKYDPTEIVGNRTDKALQFADSKRQAVGQKMGEIETKYANDTIPLKEDTFKTFVDIIDSAKNPSYGTSLADSPTVAKLISDFDTLNKNGLTIAERNKFVRSWDTVIRDAKDAFGNFKENGSVYTKIQNAVNKIKGETVDYLSTKDKVYRGLRSKYAEHIKLQEFGDALLGKDGLLGDRIKGGATVKRAIKSNSDAGARQFLIKLKEITGYDAMRDADLALTAMQNIGDFQGLSLLEVLNNGKSGIVKKVLEKGQDFIVGDESTRVKNYIKK